MNGILIAAIVVAGIGAVCAVMLVLASKFFAVKEDTVYLEIRECLPGANCGACGYAGCDGYAKALASGEESKINLCIPGADAAAEKMAEILGVEFEDVIEKLEESRIEMERNREETVRLREEYEKFKVEKDYFIIFYNSFKFLCI